MTEKKLQLKDYIKEPLVWLVLILLLGFVFGAGRLDELGLKEGEVTVGESGKLIRAISVMLVGAIAFMYLTSKKSVKYILYGTNKYLLIFFLLCVSSAVFSPLPLVTLYKSFEILVVIILLSITYSTTDLYQTSKKFTIALMFLYALTVLGVYLQFAIFGTEGQRQLVGVTPLFGFMLTSKYPGMVGNALGYLGAIVALYGIYYASIVEAKANKKRYLTGSVLFVLGAGVTFLSYTRSVMFFLFVAVFIYFVYRKKYVLNVLMILMLIVPMFIPQVQEKIVDHLRRGDTGEKIATMSGRTEMWLSVFDRRKIKIIIGDGYATGAKFMQYDETGKILAQSNVHNSFLEVVMSVGLLGAFFWLLIMLRIAAQYYVFYMKSKFKLSTNDKIFHVFMMALLFLSFSRSLMNSTFVYLDYFYPVLIAFILYGDSLKYKLKELSSKKVVEDNINISNKEEKTLIFHKRKSSILRMKDNT